MAHLWPKQATWGNNVCSSNGVSVCQMLILSLYSPASQRLHQDVWAGGFWAVLHGSVVWVWDLTVWEFWTQTVDDTRNLQLRWWKKESVKDFWQWQTLHWCFINENRLVRRYWIINHNILLCKLVWAHFNQGKYWQCTHTGDSYSDLTLFNDE